MNKLNRLISMLLCMALLFTSAVGVFAEETAEAVVTEEVVAEEVVAEVDPIEIDWDSIGLLEVLGIIDPVNEATAQEFLTAQMSRAEFAVALVKFANMQDAVGGDNQFKDVVKDSYEESYINAAVNLGLIAPVSDGYFYPKYPISYQDAAQAFVMSLGYTSLAEIDDSWMIQAKKIGLMKGVDSGAVFTRERAYKMFFNALHTEVMEITALEGNYASYEAREGVDALYRFFGIRHDKGMISGAGGVDLGTGVTNTAIDFLKVNGVSYKYGKHDLNEYIGRNAVIYYNTDKDTVYVLFEDNEELVLTAGEIIGFNNTTNEYTYGDNKKTAKITRPPYVILNSSEYLGNYVESVMKPKSGKVTLIDNSRDGVYDVVIIEAYTDHVIKVKRTTPDRIIGYYGESVSLDAGVYDIICYDETGAEITVDSLAAGNVISVASSGNKIVITRSAATVTGSISQISTKYGEEVWTIDGVDYVKSATLKDVLAAQSNPQDPTYGKINMAQMGETYKFFLNTRDEIVYYEKATDVTADDKFYAIIVAAKKEGLDAKVTIKAFAKPFGGFESLTLPKKITFNGSNATPEFVYDSLNRDGVDGYRAPAGTIYPQPVKMKVNENNEITYLAQASVAEYYSAMDKWGTTSSNYVLPEITEPNSFPGYEPEFYLYMGDPTGGGAERAYRNTIDQAVIPGTRATIEKHPYSMQAGTSGGRTLFRALRPASDITVYQVPMCLDVTDTARIGKITPEKEEFFAMAAIPSATNFRMMAYKESPDSRACSFCLNIVSADSATTVGNAFTIRLVTEITTEYINEEPVTAVNTHAGKFYIKPGTIDINALPFYSYRQTPMNNPVTDEATYKVNPGDLINISLDALGFAKAVEPVFDATNGWFLGDYQQGSNRTLSSGESKDSNKRNHPFCYGTREADNTHKIEWVYLEHFDTVNGIVEGKSYGVGTRYPINDPKEGFPIYETMNETKVFSMTPGSCTAVLIGRNGAITTKNAVGTDYVTEEDAPGEASILLLSQRYMALNGSSFLYPAEMTKNWPKSPAELQAILNPTP